MPYFGAPGPIPCVARISASAAQRPIFGTPAGSLGEWPAQVSAGAVGARPNGRCAGHRFGPFAGADPLKAVIDLNLKRRRLDESQRAMAGAKLANRQRGGNQANVAIGTMGEHEAADMLNVSRISVQLVGAFAATPALTPSPAFRLSTWRRLPIMPARRIQ